MIEMREIYHDQAPLFGWLVTTFYTPYGIQMLDTRFGRAIRMASTMEECRHIAKRLIENTHLHLTIKENLMHNLVNVMIAIEEGRGPDPHLCTENCYELRGWQKFKVRICVRADYEEL